MTFVERNTCEQVGMEHDYVCHLTYNACVFCGKVEGIANDTEKSSVLHIFDNIESNGTTCSVDGCK